MAGESSDTDRRTFLKTVGATGAAAALGSATAAATPGRDPGPRSGEVLVGVTQTVADLRARVEQYVPGNAEVVHENETLSYVAVSFPEQASATARENFKEAVVRREGVKYAEDNATYATTLAPNDPRFDRQYAPQMVDAPAAWDTTLGSGSVTVAVVDQGVQYDHEDLAANASAAESNHGDDFVDDDEDPYPVDLSTEYHGTHVAGVAAAATDNGTGTAGVSESSVLSARALGADGAGSTSDIADAVVWATDQGADVINMSLGGGGYTQTMKNAVSYAYDNGVFLACAAGNAGRNSVSYPAAYSECLAVSALDPDGSLASYSNYGSEIELAAPGTNVLSTTTTARGSYEELSGTSMATPVVSGVAGLALARWDVTNAELRAHLKDTAVDVGLSSEKQGSGRVDADSAVSAQPGSGGDGGGGGDSTSSSVTDSLSSAYDYDDWTWAWEYDDPSQVVVELSGPSDADFDLYVNTGTTTDASPSNYDYGSYSPDSQESVTIDGPDTSTEMQVDVDSYSGDGSYTLTITEYE